MVHVYFFPSAHKLVTEVTAMGKRVRKKWTILWGNGASVLVLGTVFLLGGITGGLFAGLAQGEGALELGNYLSDYLTLAAEGTVIRSFWPVLWEQMRYFLAAVVLGLTAVGVVGLPVLFGVRGFFFTFSVGCFFRVFGGAGLLPALVLFGLPALLWAPGFFLAGTQGFSNAQSLLRRGLGEGRSELPVGQMVYWARNGLCCVLFLVCSALEYVVVPVLLKAAAHAVL